MMMMQASRRSLVLAGRNGSCSKRTAFPIAFRRSTVTVSNAKQSPVKWWKQIQQRPIEYASIPCVAAFVGIMTNWMGVKMLFYPIEYTGINWMRWPDTPWGLFGWEGVVPTKTKVMAARLVKVVTERLLSLDEAFGRLDPNELSRMLMPAVQDAIRRDCGQVWLVLLQPVLPILLPHVLTKLQEKENIDRVLDLHVVVMEAFVRDKAVLIDLFQKVGRVELEFLVNSGFGFGLVLGLGQMAFWAKHPAMWTLPAAGALVGYVTNWIAIKLLFEPAEPVDVLGLFEVQGLFESRQVEVSDEFGEFMARRVLNPQALLSDLAEGGEDGELFAFLRRQLPHPIPTKILSAAVAAIASVAENPRDHPELHAYVLDRLDIRQTLARRLKTLSPIDFEDMLHPVFQEDEITLIATGGVLGLIAGAAQTQLGWGGPGASRKALITIVGSLAASAAFYLHQKYEEEFDEPLASIDRPHLQRRVSIVRMKDEEWQT
ncbi:hypothetical protein MPSEU_000825000 [Mayamaea pseudoterrestris]|nr:hypothetical protein MPSEU_000825000 [Mayamaea pseudoterrestris]